MVLGQEEENERHSVDEEAGVPRPALPDYEHGDRPGLDSKLPETVLKVAHLQGDQRM